MKTITKIIGIIILLLTLAFIGTCTWQNCLSPDIKRPAEPAAKYSVTVKATGNKYFSNQVSIIQLTTGKIVTLQGYYENVDGKYAYIDRNLALDEKIFGSIEVMKQ